MISDVLVVGVNSQAGITAVKGPPVLNSEERAAII
jgi:bifunctional ADP-heptose synthase (sugar kinase/adenylyltransferase)